LESHPFLIDSDASGRKLRPSGPQEHSYDEGWLQELLRQHPDILPVVEIEPVFSPLIPIGREVPLETGYIDNLFISPRGYLVLVETKLWRNPEAKREVVAQAIDYGSAISKWTYEKLNDAARRYTKDFEKVDIDLVDWVEKNHGPVEGGRDFFEESVAKNLRLGRFLTLIVSDRIRQPVIEMVSYVNKYPGLSMDVALIELKCFQLKEDTTWPLLVVPRVVARTEIVERSVVQVTVVGASTSEVDVHQVIVEKQQSTGRRESLTEEAFWELLNEQAPEVLGKAKDLIKLYKEMDGVEAEPKESSISVKLNLPEAGRQVSLFYLNKRGFLNVWPQTISSQLAKAGYDSELVKPYEGQMRSILKLPKSGGTDLARSFTEIDAERFQLAVNEFIRSIQTAQQKYS
jgi:hypothetical protein